MKKKATTHEKHAPELHYGIIVLALIVLAVFSALGLARFGYTSILPAMQEGLHLSNTQTGELQTMNLIGYLLTVVFAGDVFGPRLAPAALGLMTVIFGIGQAMGPYLAGALADTSQSFAPAFVIAGAIALILGAGGSFVLRTGKNLS